MGNNKNRSSTSSLPIDLIVDDILSRLPVKSLSRFKCVSKEWLNLISSPYFKHLHTQKNSQRKPFLFLWNKTGPDYGPQSAHYLVVDIVNEKLHHEFDAPVFPLHVVDEASSVLRWTKEFFHEVVCCRSLVFLWRRFPLCVCNPSTNEFVKLPPNSFRAFRDFRSCVFGFGYNPLTNEYKIVAWLCHDFKDECLVFTLTDGGRLTSGSWRSVKLQNSVNLWLDEHSVCVNGTIYWRVIWSYGPNSLCYKSRINAFELETEESNVIGCPLGHLVELKGKLCLAENLRVKSSIRIWMLKDPKNGVWVEEWNIHLPAPTPYPSPGWSADNLFFPIAYYHHDEEEHLILKSFHDELLYYNINTKRVRKANKLNGLTRDMAIVSTDVYWDGFFSLGT